MPRLEAAAAQHGLGSPLPTARSSEPWLISLRNPPQPGPIPVTTCSSLEEIATRGDLLSSVFHGHTSLLDHIPTSCRDSRATVWHQDAHPARWPHARP